MNMKKFYQQIPIDEVSSAFFYGGFITVGLLATARLATFGQSMGFAYWIDGFFPLGLAALYSIFLIVRDPAIQWMLSIRLNRIIKKNGISVRFKEWLLFLNNHQSELPKILRNYAEVMMDDLFSQPDSVKYASTVFLNAHFLEAFAKFSILYEDQEYRKSFLNSHEDSDTDDIFRKAVLKPIEDAMNSYTLKQKEYQKLVAQTHSNNIKTLLTQDFTKIHSIHAVNKDEQDLFPYEVLGNSFDFEENNPLDIKSELPII